MFLSKNIMIISLVQTDVLGNHPPISVSLKSLILLVISEKNTNDFLIRSHKLRNHCAFFTFNHIVIFRNVDILEILA